MNKKIREQVYAKTNGHCAYCGCKLEEHWHVDHMKPLLRGVNYKGWDKYKGDNSIDNLMPSCPSCNIYKGGNDVEGLRFMLERTLKASKRYTCTRMAIRYGLLQETGKEKVKFYFERLRDDFMKNCANCANPECSSSFKGDGGVGIDWGCEKWSNPSLEGEMK